MRSVVVRVSEGDDWKFQAERQDGSLLFAIEFTKSPEDPVAAAESVSDPAPRPSHIPLPYHAGAFGWMLGEESDERDFSLSELRQIVDLALPKPAGHRVVEIAARNGETTVAYASHWQGVDHWLVDPFYGCSAEEITNNELKFLLGRNREKFFSQSRVTSGLNAVDAGETLDKQDLSLLIIAAEFDREEQTKLLGVWLQHLRPDGRVVLRLPNDGDPLQINKMEFHQAGEWLLYSPVTGDSDE